MKMKKSNQKEQKRGSSREGALVSSGDMNRDHMREISRAARRMARSKGKRITMSMFFVEDL